MPGLCTPLSPSCSYCECFASGRYCDNCNCLNCFNNPENEATRQQAVEGILERNPNAFRPKIQVGGCARRGPHKPLRQQRRPAAAGCGTRCVAPGGAEQAARPGGYDNMPSPSCLTPIPSRRLTARRRVPAMACAIARAAIAKRVSHARGLSCWRAGAIPGRSAALRGAGGRRPFAFADMPTRQLAPSLPPLERQAAALKSIASASRGASFAPRSAAALTAKTMTARKPEPTSCACWGPRRPPPQPPAAQAPAAARCRARARPPRRDHSSGSG
jgi:hypothetical protein